MTTKPDVPSLTDAYAHVGDPRFASIERLWPVLRRHGVERAVFVLGPGVPDLGALAAVGRVCGGAARTVTIPWGDTPPRRREFLDCSWSAGAIGVRLMPDELRSASEVVDEVGRRGGWLFAIDAHRAADTARLLADWLERHPAGRIAAPHFLEARGLKESCADPALVRALVGHPRFHAILSRHGGVGGLTAYPHAGLRPWLDDVLPLLGGDRVAWGSEAPVLFWRDEEPAAARDWLETLLGPLGEEFRAGFLRENARRWFFTTPDGTGTLTTAPAWLAEPEDPMPVRLFAPRGWSVDARAYRRWMDAYLRASLERPGLSWGVFLAEAVDRGLDASGSGRDGIDGRLVSRSWN